MGKKPPPNLNHFTLVSQTDELADTVRDPTLSNQWRQFWSAIERAYKKYSEPQIANKKYQPGNFIKKLSKPWHLTQVCVFIFIKILELLKSHESSRAKVLGIIFFEIRYKTGKCFFNNQVHKLIQKAKFLVLIMLDLNGTRISDTSKSMRLQGKKKELVSSAVFCQETEEISTLQPQFWHSYLVKFFIFCAKKLFRTVESICEQLMCLVSDSTLC